MKRQTTVEGDQVDKKKKCRKKKQKEKVCFSRIMYKVFNSDLNDLIKRVNMNHIWIRRAEKEGTITHRLVSSFGALYKTQQVAHRVSICPPQKKAHREKPIQLIYVITTFEWELYCVVTPLLPRINRLLQRTSSIHYDQITIA